MMFCGLVMSVLKRGANPVSEQDKADIRSGIGLGSAALLNAASSGNASSTQVVKGDDTRLSDARTPTAHTHTASAVTDFFSAVDARIAAASVNALADVAVTSPTSGQVLKWNGTAWVNETDGGGGGGGSTNLSYTASPTGGVVVSDTGTDAAIPLSDGTNAGLNSPAQHIKLDGIQAGATANATDEFLIDRANHTGHQPISSVTGLQTALDGKEASGTAAAAVAAHVAAADPHPGYALESALGTAAYTASTAYATAAQGTDAREWSAETVSQAEAEAGTATTRRAFTAQRVFQAIAAWWAALTVGPSKITMSTARLLGRSTAGTGAAEEIAIGSGLSLSGGTLSATGGGGGGGSAEVSVGPSEPSGSELIWYDTDEPTDDAATVRSALGLGTAAIADSTSFATAAQGALADTAAQRVFAHDALAYSSTVNLDMASLSGLYRTVTMDGALTLTTSNRAAGRNVVLRLMAGASARALTFPGGWVFLGAAAPSSIAAGKTAVLSLSFFGSADSDCVAAYSVQP